MDERHAATVPPVPRPLSPAQWACGAEVAKNGARNCASSADESSASAESYLA
jgi:hypothetical protein